MAKSPAASKSIRAEVAALYLAGNQPQDIAKMLGQTASNVCQWVVRDGLTKKRKSMAEAVTRTVIAEVSDTAKRHLARIEELVEKKLDHLRDNDPHRFENIDVQVNALDKLNKIARLNLGLDGVEGQQGKTTFNFNLGGSKLPGKANVVEVETHETSESVEQNPS